MSSPALSACRNCGTPADGKFCPECGQSTAPHPPTAREFLHEFATQYVAIEGSLWITLKKLANPGALTLEYLAGRKRRYIHPLRLYLTASVVFFLVAQVFLPTAEVKIASNGATLGGGFVAFQCDQGDSLCKLIETRINARFANMSRAQAGEFFARRLVTLFPYAMFVLVPLFALLNRAVYWNRPFNYGEHLVFALHVMAAVYFMGAVAEPFQAPILWTVPAAMYFSVATQRVFGGRRWASILRSVFLFLTYFALIIAMIVVIVTASAFL
ncbi:MAG TPA: DUF3667 domain-containing protein [Usitatibacter sp.]